MPKIILCVKAKADAFIRKNKWYVIINRTKHPDYLFVPSRAFANIAFFGLTAAVRAKLFGTAFAQIKLDALNKDKDQGNVYLTL